MAVTIDISPDAEEALRREWGNLEQATMEALLIESYRTGKISVGFLANVLGITRWQAESWLGRRGVNWNYDRDDLEADRNTLAQVFGK